MKNSTIIYRNGLNHDSYKLESRKKDGNIFIVRIDYINGFYLENIFNNHPNFSTKKDANAWIVKKSKDSYIQDKEFIESYMS